MWICLQKKAVICKILPGISLKGLRNHLDIFSQGILCRRQYSKREMHHSCTQTWLELEMSPQVVLPNYARVLWRCLFCVTNYLGM
jgi:hypothetical protein